MSKILYCQGQLAKNPYFYLAGAVNVYSIEELAYFICNNVYKINDSIMNKQLSQWVDEELKLHDLSKVLLDAMTGFCTLSGYVGCILEASGYCDKEEIENIKSILDEIGNKNEFYRRKHKADNLLKNNQLSKSIYEYEKLLDFYGTKKEPKENVGDLYHNMGVAYGRMYLFEDSAKCFSKAFNLNESEESLEQYKICLFYLRESGKNISEFELPISNEELTRIGELIQRTEKLSRNDKTYRMLVDIDNYRDNGRMSDYHDNINKLLSIWKEECRQAID